MPSILIIDDDCDIRAGLDAVLSAEGYKILTANDGLEGVSKFRQLRPDLVLMDVMMPRMNGFKACSEIRKLDALVPIIFLTSKSDDLSAARAMSLGADDLLDKLVSESVMLAKIERALNRSKHVKAAKNRSQWIEAEDVNIDPFLLKVYEHGVETTILTKTEYSILRVLYDNAGKTFSREELIAAIRGQGFVCEDSMLYTHIHNLRNKIGAMANRIVNISRVGYVFQ